MRLELLLLTSTAVANRFSTAVANRFVCMTGFKKGDFCCPARCNPSTCAERGCSGAGGCCRGSSPRACASPVDVSCVIGGAHVKAGGHVSHVRSHNVPCRHAHGCSASLDQSTHDNTTSHKLPAWPTEMIGSLSCSIPRWPKEPPLVNGHSIALYAYNFGNYRNELGLYDRYASSGRFMGFEHRYLFVLEADVAHTEHHYQDGWVICGVPAGYIPSDAFPAHRPRHVSEGWELTKWFKFGHVPDVLSWIPSLEQLGRILAAHPTHEAFLVEHRSRQYVPQEWEVTMKLRKEQREFVCAFNNSIRAKFGSAAVDRAPLPALGQWVRKVRDRSEDLDRAFRDTFHALISFGLKRDQDVFTFALYARLGRNVSDVVKLCSYHFLNQTCPSLEFHGDVVHDLGGALDGPPYDSAHYRC